ncbi:MAG: acyltransferase family protein [Microthrixaceae bacterium]
MTTVANTSNDRLIRVDAPRLGHVRPFDGLRGIMVLGVVAYHADLIPFLKGMPLVIDWFFVASGFLITYLLLDEQNKTKAVSLRNFYTRRVLRLFPAMYAFLATFSVLAVAATLLVEDSSEFSNWWVDVLAGSFYVYNFVAAADPGAVSGAIGHIWSLTVEEQFYFIWPLLLLFALRKARRRTDMRLIVGSVLFIATFFFLRAHFQYIVSDASSLNPTFIDENDPTWQGFLYRFASMRPDMIVYGCLIAFVVRAIPRPVPERVRMALAVVGPISWIWFVVVLVFANSGIWGFDLWGGPAYQLALLLLGPGVIDTYIRAEAWYYKPLANKPFEYLGVRTYGIYLWHVIPVLIFLPAISNANGMEKLVLASITTVLGVAVGAGSYRFIERRFLAMKDRFSSLPPPKSEDAAKVDDADTKVDLRDTGAEPNTSPGDTQLPPAQQGPADDVPVTDKPTVP